VGWLNTAAADIITFNLTGLNISCNPACLQPYEEVSVELTDSTHATITFTSFDNGTYTYLMGGGGSAAVNVNATSFSLSSLSADSLGGGFNTPVASDGGSGNENGFGSFNQTINLFDGYTHSTDSISFILTNLSGTWAGASSVLTGNSQDNLAAAHVFFALDPVSPTQQNVLTGFAASGGGGGPPNETPEPQTLALLGLGLLSLTMVRRQRQA
jgi:hypothetical protein